MNISVRFSAAWKGFTGEAAQLIRACREEILSLKRQLAESELELQESKTVISGQRAVIEDFAAARTTPVAHPLEDLFQHLAAPLSQLRTQAFLIDSGKDISGQSVMTLAGQFATLVEKAGLEPVGKVGERVKYDPVLHQPLSAQASILDSEVVTVKFIGYRCNGRVIRRSLVQKD